MKTSSFITAFCAAAALTAESLPVKYEMEQLLYTAEDGRTMNYCRREMNWDQPGKAAVLIFFHGAGERGNDNEKQHNLTRYEGKSIIWFDTSKNANKEQKRTKGGSFINEEEKRIIMEIFEDLKNNDELTNLDIGVITGYSGQKDLLRKAVKAGEYDKVAQIDINTLDAFQGRENDIIIYSTVRTKDSIGFQKEKERVNVAFSRAKKLLIICGDLEFFYNYDDPNNKFIEIIDYLKEHNQQCSIISCKGGNLF